MYKLLSKSGSGPCYKCTIRLLGDSEELECEFQTNHKGRYLLDFVCEQLNLVERDYFGLRFVDTDSQRHWLDPMKSVLKQVKDADPIVFSFRVKFYPPNPFQLKEQITRYQIYLQLKRDLLHGRLCCTNEDAALLGAYILQAELGDYNSVDHVGNYATDFKIFLKQTLSIEENMIELHQTEVKGQLLEEAEANFLRKACTLDTYGVDPHQVKDQKGNVLYLGVNFNGILTFQGTRKTNHFKWNEVQKINYEGKMFIVHLVYLEDPRTKKKHTVGFKCPTAAACRYVWRCAIEQMLFFTSSSSSTVPRVVSGGGFFSGSKFKYTGRVEREVLEEMAQLLREEPPINRIGSLRRKAASVPATPSTPVINDLGFSDGNYSVSPKLNYNSFENRSNYPEEQVNIKYNADGSAILEPLMEVTEQSNKAYSKRNEESNTVHNELTAINDKNEGTTNVDNFKESFSESTLYYNREPTVEYSSSESHMTTGGTTSHRSSRSQTPVPKGNVHFSSNIPIGDDITCTQKVFSNDYTLYENSSMCSKMYSCFKACLPSILLSLTSLLVVMVITFEIDAEFFLLLRRAPEMVFIRREYYEPIKEHIKITLNQLFSKSQK